MPALDGLRAAAVVAVLLFHAGHLQGGFLGVDLFFALSGFLITSLLLRDADHGGVRLLAFWGRRFRRLLPAVFVLIAVVALGAWMLGTPAELDGVRRTGGWALAYMANWHFIGEANGYWASFDQPSMFDHLWSLAIEEQFYVVWPLVVLAVWKVSRRRYRHRNLLAVTLGGVVASFVAMLVLYEPGADPTRIYMGTDTRAASILVGAAMATAPARRVASAAVGVIGRRIDQVIAVLLLGIGVSWVVVDGANSAVLYRGGLLLHSAVAAAIVVALASTPTGRARERVVVASARLGGRALVRAVPVALAGVRDVDERAHGTRRCTADARAHRRLDRAGGRVVLVRRRSDPPPRVVGSRPARHPGTRGCGRAGGHDVDRAPPSAT